MRNEIIIFILIILTIAGCQQNSEERVCFIEFDQCGNFEAIVNNSFWSGSMLISNVDTLKSELDFKIRRCEIECGKGVENIWLRDIPFEIGVYEIVRYGIGVEGPKTSFQVTNGDYIGASFNLNEEYDNYIEIVENDSVQISGQLSLKYEVSDSIYNSNYVEEPILEIRTGIFRVVK